MELDELVRWHVLEVNTTGIQSTTVEQIPVREVEGEYNQGVVELAERVAVIVIAGILEACIRFLIPDQVYCDFFRALPEKRCLLHQRKIHYLSTSIEIHCKTGSCHDDSHFLFTTSFSFTTEFCVSAMTQKGSKLLKM